MLLANSTKLQPVKKSWGQGACTCPLHVFLHFKKSCLERITLKSLPLNCFHRQERVFFPRRMLRKAEQTLIEFVKLEEHLLGKKNVPIADGMNSETDSKQGKSFELFFCDAPEDRSVVEWFMSFLEGEHGPFPLPLVFNFSPFTKKVLEELKKIPLGKSLSYRQVAENIGHPKAARAVGNACNVNPFPLVIPCHRVVQTGGKPGGFAYGTELKEDLLHFERETIAAMQAL